HLDGGEADSRSGSHVPGSLAAIEPLKNALSIADLDGGPKVMDRDHHLRMARPRGNLHRTADKRVFRGVVEKLRQCCRNQFLVTANGEARIADLDLNRMAPHPVGLFLKNSREEIGKHNLIVGKAELV